MKRIASRDNREFRRLRSLARSTRARTRGQMLLDGAHLVDAYVAAFGASGLQLFVQASSIDRPEVAERLRLSRAPVVLSDALFGEISPVETPTGLLAVAPIPESQSVTKTPADRFSVFLDGLQDPGNLGAVLRSAAAAGACDTFVSVGCADPWSAKCLRAGMGAHFQLTIHDRVDLVSTATNFDGRLIAADSRGERSLFEVDLAGRIGFVVGGEGSGISPEVLELAAERVRIPMVEGIESLNVAAAATLVFYEWRRQRRMLDGKEV